MVHPKHLTSKESLVRLWCHEGARVFRDRLVDKEDRNWYDNVTLSQLHSTLSCKDWILSDFNSSIYGIFLQKNKKEYQEFSEKSKIQDRLHEYLEEYNMTSPCRMDFIFFEDAVCHVARISRILCQSRGEKMR